MAMRDLVTGGAGCGVPGGAHSSSNPVGALANALVGSSSKTQERVKEIPVGLTGSSNIPSAISNLTSLPGAASEIYDHYNQQHFGHASESDFLQGFHDGYADAWHEAVDQVDQFHDQSQNSLMPGHMRSRAGIVTITLASEQAKSLVQIISQNQDSKFQNSKFLQFVSKISRGELIVEDNQVKQADSINAWADEFQRQHDGGNEWAEEFYQQGHARTDDEWVNEFSDQHEAWAEEFSHDETFRHAMFERVFDDDEDEHHTTGGAWPEDYQKYLAHRQQESSKSGSSNMYAFADQNPYVGHPNPIVKGRELFQSGLLSEAVLALEAEVLKNPENAQAWRLLGMAHIENDDERQAISCLMKAKESDPTNLQVLLALFVSHTNEFNRPAALSNVRAWLQHHSKYATDIPPEQLNSLSNPDLVALLNGSAEKYPEEADVQTVLGVFYCLYGEHDKATDSFKAAIAVNPNDYSLWNKLAATQANSGRNRDEQINGYRRAIELKPNYVRAWANMDISYANQGCHGEAIPCYVRALKMNPKSDTAWIALRRSLTNSGARRDLLVACDMQEIDALHREFHI